MHSSDGSYSRYKASPCDIQSLRSLRHGRAVLLRPRFCLDRVVAIEGLSASYSAADSSGASSRNPALLRRQNHPILSRFIPAENLSRTLPKLQELKSPQPSFDIDDIHSFSELLRTDHWPFSCDCCNIRGQYHRGRMNRLYQWLTGRAGLFRSGTTGRGPSRTVRTEIMLERQTLTVLVNGAAMVLDTCPRCGQKLAPAQAEQARLRLQKASISPEDLPVDGNSP